MNLNYNYNYEFKLIFSAPFSAEFPRSQDKRVGISKKILSFSLPYFYTYDPGS